MKRQPSIHITEKNLIVILQRFIPHGVEGLAEEILVEARRYSCDNRLVNITNEKIDRKVKKLLKSNKGDTGLLSNIIYSIRKKLNRKGIRKIKEGDRDWLKIKELATLTNDFCNDFDLSRREGYILYISTGFNIIKSTSNYLNKLLGMYEKISLTYEAELIIINDKNKSETLHIHNLYVMMITEKTGITNRYENDPIAYTNFVKVKEITNMLNVDFEIYLKSQFDGLAWTDSYPEPSQLISTKSTERLNKYLYKNKLTTNPESIKKDLKSILENIKNDHNRGK